MLTSQREIVKFISEKSKRVFPNMNCWIMRSFDKRFSFYIFTYTCENSNQLVENYNLINNDIAVFFQTGLEIDVEKWNIYLFCFVKEEVNKDLKYKIEQNKYSTRKIVIDKQANINDEVIKRAIEQKLFVINIKHERCDKSIKSLHDILMEKDRALYGFFFEYFNAETKNKPEILKSYLKGLE
ncbi:ABC-three component system middle component 1 [Desulforamulus aeronauticus]|uniref:Uncharacterized protein n=1 Tax=Desulforamulus aeronauticus DSM 10349 TaxID=1121421 RepID=A0A1M6QEZ6_9FIRM|nr:ABC-three component system middle component 1 [Desulforamulus aeronauticus]SHK18839.1 hypothetical protein SAMN02745123_01010 [Desulforamulus aeronauticus DSM 10349]